MDEYQKSGQPAMFAACSDKHARIQEFSSGGSRSIWQNKLWRFFILVFFLVLSLF